MKREHIDLHDVAERMQPGAISLRGFLGEDQRDLADILRDDEAAVAALGLSHRRIAGRLDHFTQLALSGYGAHRREGDFEVIIEEARGFVRCPFEDSGRFRKGEIHLTKTSTGETLVWTPLLVHMIAAHGFYEGRGAHYRLDPANIRSILDL